jgi:hypothetical protein
MPQQQQMSRTTLIAYFDSYEYLPILSALFLPHSGVFMLTYAAKFTLRFICALRHIAPAEPIHEMGKFKQVRYAEKCSLPAHNHLGIGGNNVRPLWPNRDNCTVIGLQQQGRPIAVVSLAYARQLLPAQWMKWMRYQHKTLCCDRCLCILG